ncbi:MAG: cyclic nucleotide-binding domain-containing protein [Deltaproteobacteria bacterium]|nr:cyclic nucleotide-binding domain-containing protein [Deltaproteobacteria bacterium]
MTLAHCCQPGPREEKRYNRLRDALESLSREGNPVHYRKGQVIFYEGHHPCGFYLLRQGKVSLKESRTSGGAKMHPTEDKLLGLMHLLSDTPYCSTCTAEDDVDIVFIPKTTVSRCLDEK